jgi:hypothetical protein
VTFMLLTAFVMNVFLSQRNNQSSVLESAEQRHWVSLFLHWKRIHYAGLLWKELQTVTWTTV